MDLKVHHDEDRSRYELRLDGHVVGIADYYDTGGALVFPHTEIDADHRGQGLGAWLVREALVDVGSRGRTVVAQCWFVREFLDTHPEFAHLRAA